MENWIQYIFLIPKPSLKTKTEQPYIFTYNSKTKIIQNVKLYNVFQNHRNRRGSSRSTSLPKILFPNFLRFRAETASIVTFFCWCSMKNRKDTLLMVSVALHIASKSSHICSLLIIIESYNVSNNSILHLWYTVDSRVNISSMPNFTYLFQNSLH